MALHTIAFVSAVGLASAGPCDIFGAAGTPCVAAHSMIRALYANYSGPLYQLRRQVDNATQDIGVLAPGGFANAAAQDTFCSGPARPLWMPPLGYTVNIVPTTLPALSFRHCYQQAFVTPTDTNEDHQFKIVPALNGNANQYSFQSVNYDTSYIAPVTNAEPGRLGIVEGPSPDDASWTVTPVGNGGAVTISLASRGGLAMTVGTNLTGTCASSYTPPSVSVYMEDPSLATTWTFNTTGYPPAAACQVWTLYDQSPYGNHLVPAGPAINNPDYDNPVNATRHPLTVGGHKVYGAFFETGMGYRVANTTGVAKGNDPETLYMVTSGTHVNDGCCFDYGNAEADPTNSSAFRDGTMEAINFSTSDVSGYWCGGEGDTGPWILADLENGLWACGTAPGRNNNNTPLTFPFVTAMVKGGTNGFALKGGNANAGNLTTMYDGPRPSGYQPMQKAGAIILGMGGDNVDRTRSGRKAGKIAEAAAQKQAAVARTGSAGQGNVDIPTIAIGTFYEGAITQGYTTDVVDAALQADIVAAGYGQ